MTAILAAVAAPACGCVRADHVHGTCAMYTIHRCRCFPCRITYSNAHRDYLAGGRLTDDQFVDRRGTSRRLEALHAVGWSESALAAHLQMTKQGVRSTRVHPGQILRGTAGRVADVYEELWNRPPSGRFVARTLAWARANAFAPPLAWDDIDHDHGPARPDQPVVVDEVVVDRLIAGHRPQHVTRTELVTAVARMHARGLTDQQIGDRVGMKGDSVNALRLRSHARELVRLVDLGVDLDTAATLTERTSA